MRRSVMADPTLTFLGAAGTVTGSKFLLSIEDKLILVDAGLFQGEKKLRNLNRDKFRVDPARIDSILLTHAHADHSAYLPALVRRGFRGPIWATPPTIGLTEIVLRDSAKLQEQAAEEARDGGWSKHKSPEALYTMADVEDTLPLLRAVDWDTNIDIDGVAWATWTHSAHILGAASIRVEFGNRSVLFSGDVGRHTHPILRDREIPQGADIVLCESTYGDRLHPEPAQPHADLADAICRTVSRGGQVLIPAFAIDRTELVLQALVQLRRDGLIPAVPVAVDGPMSLRALDIYRNTPEELRPGVSVGDFTDLNLLETRERVESKKLNNRTDPMIIISSSGMLEGGRVLYHLRRLLPDPVNTLILTGYQAEGTRGRAIAEGAPAVKINGRYIAVKAEIVRDDEFSVHGDRSDLIDWLKALTPPPEIVFTVHGELKVSTAFASDVRREVGCLAVVPTLGEVISLAPA
ncbi:metallo-beta-lactamase family protein [Tessaracoccus bendigoensis DSM 12906]|uniref:Metallo-beta-lactamase family protein n=1 Tax=Tessaracoccus bendigoensis DSM 12906 TaxID=1123357 RepID=A0A1M6E7Q1_9ACTN|nr:MBL fold metallo-hydrolase [Tessaracoccus bendigoensis]SHI81502.1 metallo-beta-lactamase family protein [Tessaracoccus bendigoensis DSM 12906]